jgi:cysteine dioxygenase
MESPQAQLASPPDFQDATSRILRAIADARGSAKTVVLELLAREPRFLSRALELAEPAPADGTPYSRRILFSSPLGDAMVAGWRAGARCLPHDHSGAHGVVTVLKGRFFEQAYQLRDGFRAVGGENEFATGDFRLVVPGEIHSLRAEAGGITLHLYAPPIRGMRIYDETSRTIYTVADDCGAWIPRDERLIRARTPLDRHSLHD